MKICVYAISKNEEKFCHRWFNSMKEADEIYVLDTGSTDNTVDLLTKLGVHVKKEIIKPWRFDEARNKSLEMVPLDTDICVCTDLDEIFDHGWRKILEDNFKDNTRCLYNYIWSFDKYGNPAVNFYHEKIHIRNGYIWVNPVHEVLMSSLPKEKRIIIDDITLRHYPDAKKSRSSYLPLLKLAVKENPHNDRNRHYLGREYMYYGKYYKAIKELKYHLKMKEAVWDAERCASARFICRCYKYLKDYKMAIKYGLMAISECPSIREPYYELALVYYDLNDLDNCLPYLLLALNINNNGKVYINEPDCYNGKIEDILSVYYYYQKDYNKALEYAQKALEYDPENERIIKNKELILFRFTFNLIYVIVLA